MGSRQDEKLRSLLRQAGLPKPPEPFTGEVMQEIEAMAGDGVYVNAALKSVLQRNEPTPPSAQFTHKVLHGVRNQARLPAYPPVISKTAWGLIGLFVFAYALIAVVIGQAGDQGFNQPNSIFPVSYIRTLIADFGKPLSYLGLIALATGLLLVLDYLFNKRVRSAKLFTP